ncbi:helix-turn-helix domain-containing protein [Nocardiopsis kunsanensis]|uniref:helix-turn-helix domain-containing protein n=1 Tax=Nocardiopsis kunsanensis TaxID=141693 RepID=UPI001E2DBEC7|nr:helix-turn-helix transcriptional regulator [Nocardiopsis kunsanensis]
MWSAEAMASGGKSTSKAALVRFGNELQRLRRSADLSQRELAKGTLISHQMLGSIERAERGPRRAFAEKADQVLGARGALVRLWPGDQEGYPHGFKEYVELEQEARVIHDFQTQVVPGFFQTPDYARAVLGASWPPIEEAELERLLATRVDRQKMLERRKPPLIWSVLDESVLRRPVGTFEAMEAQLDRLVALAAKPHIQLQILPFAKGVHPALDGAFTALDMGSSEHLAYAEMPGTGRVTAATDDVEQCTLRFGVLRSLALSPDESVDLISRYKEAHRHGIDPV